MKESYGSIEATPLIVSSVHLLAGTHRGTVIVESGGVLNLHGTLQGSLSIKTGANVVITGAQQGSVAVAAGAAVTVQGSIQGSTDIASGATVTIEPSGKLAGSLHNNGLLVLRGVFGGTQSGSGAIRIEGDGYVKQPTSVKDGVHYYEW
jgi:cytoskeletal protein CcmA (bactofilin family)